MMIGTITTGTPSRIYRVSVVLVRASITRPPTRFSEARRAMDRLTPEMLCTSVVSVVRRDSTSPVRVTSKKVGSMRITRR